jgi:hypothetical protein
MFPLDQTQHRSNSIRSREAHEKHPVAQLDRVAADREIVVQATSVGE